MICDWSSNWPVFDVANVMCSLVDGFLALKSGEYEPNMLHQKAVTFTMKLYQTKSTLNSWL